MNHATSRDIPDIAQQMQSIIEDSIRESVGNVNYDGALNYIEVFHDGMEEIEEPEMYNSWMSSLKKKMLDGKMNGDRSEMWYKIRTKKFDVAMQRPDDDPEEAQDLGSKNEAAVTEKMDTAENDSETDEEL